MQASLALIRSTELLYFRECFNASKQCDGHLDCSDSTDEMDCPPGTLTSTRATAVTAATLPSTTFETTTPAVTTNGTNSSITTKLPPEVSTESPPQTTTKLPPEVSTESPPPPVAPHWPPI